MGDENQPSKKRAAGRELSRDNPGLDDEEDVPEQETGTFKKASDDVLATRKIVKVRRQPSSTPSAPSLNPFAGIQLVPTPVTAITNAQPTKAKASSEASDGKDETNTEKEVTSKESEEKQREQEIDAVQPDQKNHGGLSNTAETEGESKVIVEKTGSKDEPNTEKEVMTKESEEKQGEQEIDADQPDKKNNGGPSDTAEKPAETDVKQEENGKSGLSSFQQLSNSQNAFTGFSGSGFSNSSFSFGSILKDASSSQFNLVSTPLFGTTGSSIEVKSMQEVPRETGEENEETVFSAESALFEYLDGGWKERGKGEVKLNVLKTDSQKARLVMRAKGNLRLMLNASIFADMKLTKMDKKGITFACVNTATEGKDGLSTFALKFKDVSTVEEFISAVSAHKASADK